MHSAGAARSPADADHDGLRSLLHPLGAGAVADFLRLDLLAVVMMPVLGLPREHSLLTLPHSAFVEDPQAGARQGEQ